ncbi:glycosyltransferase family 2 protein [Paucilactobacillus nenjiangensis]|uniref:glycosyltransferase family 2 protein n=1 Tax=Paucilactobacillus nenjiangensis TaxID=1296540 RepID=UPI0010F92F71|nr:glycosyltransferase family 2 protein [Paucilactobacillus nenjiangensis]
MDLISIIVPCFNEEETVNDFYNVSRDNFNLIENVRFEYIFIDDGSTDETLKNIKHLSSRDNIEIHYVSFSRNFGKEAALYAGLKYATGKFVVVMDVDLQDPPKLVKNMYELINTSDIDCVAARRVDRTGEPRIKSLFSNIFYFIINKLSDTKIVPGARDFRMMTRKMVDSILSMTEYNRFSKGIFSWVGFETKYLEYKNVERKNGSSSWPFWKLFRYSVDGITDFSEVPLALASWVGTISFILSIFGMAFIVLRAIIVPGSSVYGWASLICVFLLFGGIQLLCLGIVGKYIGKIYLQTKNRPIYIVRETK